MESSDTLVGDLTGSENEMTPNSSLANDVPVINRNQNSISNRSSAKTTFINHERKRSISNNIGNEFSNNENFFSRSSISSNEDGSNKRPNKQEVHHDYIYFHFKNCVDFLIRFYSTY